MSQLNDLNTAVAIIGIACRFPDARNPLEFWNKLEAGHESLRDLTAAELEEAGVDAATLALSNFVRRGAIVPDIDLFDARLFGFTPTEAQILDPQQRIFLQCAWEALEDAGYDPMRYTESIGIFAGADQSGYQYNIYSNPELVASVGQFAITLSNDKDHLTTRTAFTLNLKGPAVTVQTNCSTSLVAVCQACQSLLSYQCDIALAGGSAIAVPQTGGYFSREGGIESPDGHCRTFDALARGTVGGNGAGLVVLKRYDAALADGDQIYAVIRGFATNNDGGDKVSYTAPSITGQAAVIAAALAMADVDAESIGYIEAHGTGTSLGDPIEIAALTEVFRRYTARKQFCGVGSVKSNIGHLGSAAGVAGLIKTVFALKNRKIPPSLHYRTPNPAIDFKNSPFYVAASLIDWEESLEPRRAGVSSFGVGGTNAHVVLEEAPVSPSVPSSEWQILPISAKTSSSRDRMTMALTACLDSEQPPNLADAAYTLQMGRREFAHRQALLAKPGHRTVIFGSVAANPLQIAMLFPGQGSQEVGMAAELYKAETVFRDCLDECCAKLIGHLGFDLRDVLYPRHSHVTDCDLSQTAVAQPALFIIEYALAKLWMDWGIQPSAMAGHSIGEYVAACLSGVFTLEDALALVTERGRLMQSTRPGAMLAVYQPAESLEHLFTNGLSLAAANGPATCVVAGDYATIEHTQAKLNAASISWRRLETSHAFHSASMEPVLGAFVDCMRKVTLRAPALPYLSNLTGTWITPEQATDPEYWGRHLRETVRFGKNLNTLKQREELAFLEVGPGQSLTTLVRHAMNGTHFLSLSSLPRVRSEESAMKTMRESLASLWVNGATVNWEALHRGEKRQRISLPTYAFDQQRYWINRSAIALKTAPSHSPLQEDAPQSALTQQSSHVAARPELSTPYIAPRNATEEAIAKLWENILGLEKVGIHDHFLDCGGHSLLAVQMISRLRDLLHAEVSIATFFEGPTVAELARNLNSTAATNTPLAPQPRPVQIPLSTGQKRLWFLDQLEGSSSEYNLPEALRMRGPLDVSALARSINGIVERHESLRTSFVLIDGEPIQRIVPSLVIPLLPEDAGAKDEASLLAEVMAALRREWEEPFDLAHGPLLRARLLQLAPEDHILLVTFHHIVSDAWSLGIFNRELAEIYNASLEGRRHSLDPLPLQYADFSLWEQLSVDEEKFARDLGYWKHQLAGLTGRLALPTDRSRPAALTYSADICSVKMDSSCLAALQKLSQENQATLYMTLLAAFSVLLERYCGQTDFPIATPVSNRPASQLEPLIGFFVNSLVMRVKVDLTGTFTDLLSEVRRTTLDAYEHQNVPFERLVDELAFERSLSHAPLSQVVFALQNAPGSSPTFSGLSTEPISGSDLRVRFDLEVHVFENDGTLHLHWIYSRDLFDHWRIEQMAHHFVKLLTELPKSSDLSLHSLSILSSSERSLLTAASAVSGGDIVAVPVLTQFEAIAAVHPGATAAIFGGASLSYSELNARANRLAHLLIRQGVRPGAIIGISLPRSFDMLVALLATLKAGAAYLPLDPSYPQARLQAMIADAQPALVLNSPLLDTSLCPDHNPEVLLTPDHPAYVLYTSGSTGTPKGVLIRNAELARYLAWAGVLYESSAGCGAPVNTPLAFDATITSLWLPLLSGKTVFLLPDQEFIPALGDLLVSGHDFTLVKLTPAHLTALADYLGDRATAVRARRFVVGGEALKATVANFWNRHVPGLRIVNEYGPTETVVGCCVHTMEPGEQVSGDVPIGLATHGTRLYVLDHWLEPVPLGVWGELYIGGPQVGAGYLNRTALTAERFLADRWAGAGERMYRTGDRVRRRQDGTLEFEGRTDQQIKIRGFRIEPGEIEAALTAQPEISQAVVVARDAGQQQARLVAYVIPAAEAQIDTASLRKTLAEQLPDYMVPAAFVPIQNLPLSQNGKIDRNALPQTELPQNIYRQPRNPTEEILCRVMAEILDIDQVGADDDFFELGGHSLSAARVASRLNEAFKVVLPIRVIFEYPKFSDLGAAIERLSPATIPESDEADEVIDLWI